MPALLPILAFVALLAPACNKDSETTTPTTATTTPTTTQSSTETYEGSLNKNGAATFSFSASEAGTVVATLTSFGPDATIAVGLSLGNWSGTACSAAIANDTITQGGTVTGTLSTSASLCVRIYDVGNIETEDKIPFTITVVHP
jgi:hypothetical protein